VRIADARSDASAAPGPVAPQGAANKEGGFAASIDLVRPDDVHNRRLVENVHPPGWTNPRPEGRYNLVVLGAGTAGLVSAVGAAGLGARVAIVERHLMGGDCLNVGCVPSKGVLRASRAAAAARDAGEYGVRIAGPIEVDFGAAMERMRRLRAGISHNDSAHRLAKLGIDVYFGDARFVAPDAVEVGGARLRFARAVIATGGRPAAPPVPGLAEAGFLTNETVFSLTELPRRLVVVGAGPIGCELAQVFRRFGSAVTVVSLDPRLLPREDADAAAVLAGRFEREGVVLRLGAKLLRVERRDGAKVVVFAPQGAPNKEGGFAASTDLEREGRAEEVVGDEILVAVGRAPNVEGLDLETAGVTAGRNGVEVDDRLRTTNRRIYAAGDVCSAYKFTHAADAMARIVIQNALFFGRKKASALVIPWCTYTAPEIAHVGLYEREARERGFDVTTITVPLAEIDRAVLDGDAEGFARVHADRKSGRILGATLVAGHAGEMIGEMALAITARLTLGTLAGAIHPYPTQAEAWKRAGDAWNRSRLTPRARGILQRVLSFRR
jgi:pyruvate/2-oxoglutarate dehydrogenase complex dihydrolipoamide dehydrogenase (E3) component